MIEINVKKCVRCGKCAEICPGNLIKIKNRHAEIRDVRDCWGCMACMKICPQKAIYYQLAADLGGNGAKMTVKNTESEMIWKIEQNLESKVVRINKNEANKY